MANFTFPMAAELTQIAQTKMARLQQDRAPFEWFPIVEKDTWLLLWQQYDNYVGLQQVRGLEGEPPRVKPVGLREYTMQPGVYGEYLPLGEAEMTTRAAMGTFATPINVSDLVAQRQDQLLLRRLDRVELIIWTLITTGTFAVPGPNGAILHTDSFVLQTYTAAVPWTTSLTATPLGDFSNVQLLARGYSVDFGADATAYMNRQTFNALRTNTNPADLYGRRMPGLSTPNNMGDINKILTGNDLPKIVVYDQTYLDENGVPQVFIPFGKVVVVGRRPAGQRVGEFRMVRNANNPNMGAGPYMRVIDKGEQVIPRIIEVHDGFNGGPCLFFPSAIVVMTVV
jgi:hypothetical protein